MPNMPVSATEFSYKESAFGISEDRRTQMQGDLSGSDLVGISYSVAMGVLIGAITSVFSQRDVFHFEVVRNPPSPEAIKTFSSILKLLRSKGILPKKYVALEEGGIMTYFGHGGAVITFEIDNDGDAAYLWEKNGESRIQDVDKKQFASSILSAFE